MKNPKNRIKQLRNEHIPKLTQENLANEMGVTKLTISRWENEEVQIKPDKAKELADFFNVDVGYLLGYNKAHERVYELFGYHPEKGSTGISTLDEIIEKANFNLSDNNKSLDDFDENNSIYSELVEDHYLRFIKDKKTLDQLTSDTLVAIKFIESIQNNLLHGRVRPNSLAWEMEKVSSKLLDLYNTIEQRKGELSNNEV